MEKVYFTFEEMYPVAFMADAEEVNQEFLKESDMDIIIDVESSSAEELATLDNYLAAFDNFKKASKEFRATFS